MADYRSFLRVVPMFSELPAGDMDQLCHSVKEVRLKAGEVLFTEGGIEHQAYVIVDGRIEIYKNSNGRSVQLAVRLPGEVIGELALLENAPRSASGRALEDSLLLSIDQDQFNDLVAANPMLSRTMLHTIAGRLRTTELMLQQSERLAHLGMFSAGLAHELNNPAAAVGRSAGQLQDAFMQFRDRQLQFETLHLSAEQLEALQSLAHRVQEAVGKPTGMSGLAVTDREAAIEDWLIDHDAEDAWEAVPILAEAGIQAQDLEVAFAGYRPQAISSAVQWLGSTYTVYSLLREISMSAGRMTEIVRALKSYVYLDQAPVQDVDVHAGLEDTLVILRHKLKDGVKIRREFDPNLPKIEAYGSELNQVWTNLIDNAIDALQGHGQIALRTRREGAWVVVDVEDDGPGIPENIRSLLFSPFFTTKEPGKGTGLGLNISYNIVSKHGGDITVRSKPGQTVFTVKLPVMMKRPAGGTEPETPTEREKEEGEQW